MFQKILIANRGEIALRILRTCRELNIKTVGIYAYEDRFSLHRYKTDESYLIGQKDSPVKTYLDINSIIHLACKKNVDAIHPGYGFLSENPDFASQCLQSGINFIGPPPEILSYFSDKIQSQNIAKKAGLTTISSSKEVETIDEAIETALSIGYPIILKSVFGGGGKEDYSFQGRGRAGKKNGS